ncbi:MAG: hypothetical protein ACOH2F_08875 [Cellulomonas sp.]
MAQDVDDVDQLRRRLELVATALLALATLLTAWSAFQATKWSGVQANNYSAASAARTESVRASNTANSLTTIDVNTFVAWVTAVADERGGASPSAEPYTPQPGTLSGFLYERFRDEFRPAVDAWLATRPLLSPDAPPTPFAMPEYRLAETTEAAAFAREADDRSAEARRANQRGDNYVLLTVLFVTVSLFAGSSTKLDVARGQQFLLALAVLVLVGATIALIRFPVQL